MRNKSKIISCAFLALSIGATSCSPPTQEQLERERLITQVKDNTLSIPSITTGGVSGTVSYINSGGSGTNIIPGEVRVRVVRQNDIPKLNAAGRPVDISGREFTDSKTQTQAFLEKKNDVIKNEVLTYKDRFSVTGIRPGDVTIIITAGSEETQQNAKVTAGTITQVPNIVLGSAAKNGVATKIGINIKGRVLRPDGTPVANAKVSDVTQNAVSASTTTNAQGEFSLQVNSFTKPKNLEATFNNITTSLTVSPEQTEDVIIPLLTNARTIKGRLVDSVNKKPIVDIPIKSVDSNSSTSTNSNGEFTLRGVPVNLTTLEIGPKNGYVIKQQVVEASETETSTGDIEVIPLGNLLINLVADNYPDSLEISGAPLVGNSYRAPLSENISKLINGYDISTENCRKGEGELDIFINNSFRILEPLTGTVQIEGTNITKDFILPPTPTKTYQCNIGLDEKEPITVFGRNYAISVPINNLPGGEYTLSVTAPFHETQKGIRIVVPSNDTISTELIQLRQVNRILAIGDVRGKIVIKDINNNSINSNAKIRVVALRGEVDLRNRSVLDKIFGNEPEKEMTNQGLISSYYDGEISNSSTLQYALSNVPTGTRVIIAGVISEGKLDENNYLLSSYVSLNVVANTLNTAPDINLTRK